MKKNRLLQSKIGGFTLLELVLYMGIIGLVASVGVGVLFSFTRVENRETAAGEVSTQSDLILRQIQNAVRSSSGINLLANTPTSTLTLYPSRYSTNSTTTIFASGTDIYFFKNPAGASETGYPIAVNSKSVHVDSLTFTKLSNPGAKDVVQVDFTLSYAYASNTQSVFSKTFHSAISRVSAAVFDSDLLPNMDNSYNVGNAPTARWRDANFSGAVTIGRNFSVNSTNLYVDSASGNVAVGTSTPATFFSVGSSTNVFNVTLGGNVGVGTTSPATLFTVATSTNIFNVTIGGRVGVGTSTPSSLLQIYGGDLAVGGSFIHQSSTPSRCARYDSSKKLVPASADCAAGAVKSVNFVIENPVVGEDDYLMTFNNNSTITAVYAVNKPISGNQATFNLVWSSSMATATSSANQVFAAYQLNTATGTPALYTSFANPTVSAGSVMRLSMTSASSTHFGVTVYYDENQ